MEPWYTLTTLSSIISTLTNTTEIEIMDAFRHHNLIIYDTLQQQLLAEGTKLVKFNLKPTGHTTTSLSHINRSSSYQEHLVGLITLGLLLSGWIVTVVVAHVIYRCIQKLQIGQTGLLPSHLAMFCSPVCTHSTG